MQHPDHDRLIKEVPGWYQASSSEMGYHTVERPFGFYSRNIKAKHGAADRVTIKDITFVQVPAFILDLHKYYDNWPVQIYIDDRETDAKIGDALIAYGCIKDTPEIYLAHVGSVPELPPVPGLGIESVDLSNLSEYAKIKLMGFSDREDKPDSVALQSEISLRKAEMAGMGRFLLARMHDEGVAAIGFYHQRVRLIFQLATRVPFRRNGIAGHLIIAVLNEAYQEGQGAVILNADETGTPIKMYHKLGFTDEIYWRQGYQYQPDNP